MRAHEFVNEAIDKAALAKQAGLANGGLTYYGDKCTKDCSGHRAGREWAIRKGIATPNQMPFGSSNSFHQGGTTYTKEKSVAQQRAAKAAKTRPQPTVNRTI